MRNSPVRYLFYIAGVLACASVIHWLAVVIDPEILQRGVYHRISTIQAFVTCLVAALVFFKLQEEGADLKSIRIRVVIGAVGSIGTALSAWLRYAMPREIMLGVSQVFWLALVLFICWDGYRLLFRKGSASKSYCTIWFVSAVLFGIAGAVILSVFSSIQVVTGEKVWWLVFLGRGYLLQCMVLSVMIGCAPIFLPEILESKPEAEFGRVFHLLCVIVLAASIPVEFWVSSHAGLWLRLAVTYLTIIVGTGLTGKPDHKTPLSLCLWASAWLIPVGYAFAALFPANRMIGLHFVFIGGFTLGPLAVVLYRVIGDNIALKKSYNRHLPVGLFSSFILASMLFRAMGEKNVLARWHSWGFSTISYIFGVVLWVAIIYLVYQAKGGFIRQR